MLLRWLEAKVVVHGSRTRNGFEYRRLRRIRRVRSVQAISHQGHADALGLKRFADAERRQVPMGLPLQLADATDIVLFEFLEPACGVVRVHLLHVVVGPPFFLLELQRTDEVVAPGAGNECVVELYAGGEGVVCGGKEAMLANLMPSRDAHLSRCV